MKRERKFEYAGQFVNRDKLAVLEELLIEGTGTQTGNAAELYSLLIYAGQISTDPLPKMASRAFSDAHRLAEEYGLERGTTPGMYPVNLDPALEAVKSSLATLNAERSAELAEEFGISEEEVRSAAQEVYDKKHMPYSPKIRSTPPVTELACARIARAFDLGEEKQKNAAKSAYDGLMIGTHDSGYLRAIQIVDEFGLDEDLREEAIKEATVDHKQRVNLDGPRIVHSDRLNHSKRYDLPEEVVLQSAEFMYQFNLDNKDFEQARDIALEYELGEEKVWQASRNLVPQRTESNYPLSKLISSVKQTISSLLARSKS